MISADSPRTYRPLRILLSIVLLATIMLACYSAKPTLAQDGSSNSGNPTTSTGPKHSKSRPRGASSHHTPAKEPKPKHPYLKKRTGHGGNPTRHKSKTSRTKSRSSRGGEGSARERLNSSSGSSRTRTRSRSH